MTSYHGAGPQGRTGDAWKVVNSIGQVVSRHAHLSDAEGYRDRVLPGAEILGPDDEVVTVIKNGVKTVWDGRNWKDER
jgi:hypothetical protein